MKEEADRKGAEGTVEAEGDQRPDLHFSILEKHILQRILGGNDFPATSAAVLCITKLASTEETSVPELTNIILKDYGLTSKLLKIVNTVNYARFGEVTTVSRALILLGTESMKNLAICMSLFEVVGRSSRLFQLLAKAIYAGMLGQKVAEKIRHVNPEEAFICTLFHFFGEILTAYYAADKYKELVTIRKNAKEKGRPEDEEACRSLYERIGVNISTGWGFPDKMIRCMKKLTPDEITGKGETDWLHCICVLSNKLAEIGRNAKNRKEQAKAAFEMFGNRFAKIKDIADVINTPREEFKEYCAAYDLNIDKFPDEEEVPAAEETGRAHGLEDMLENMRLDLALKKHEDQMTPEVIFSRGLQDITNTIIDNRYGNVNDIMRVIMETMYRGLAHASVSKVAFFIKSTHGDALDIRSIIGDSLVDARTWMNIPLNDESFDVFNLSIRERKDLVVGNSKAYDLSRILPPCFEGKIESDVYLILLPVIVNDVSIGVFYIEGPSAPFHEITLSQFHQLKILMDQAVLAIKRRASRPVVPDDPETKHRNTLGLAQNDGVQEIKSKYRQLLLKYHPDKVQHLGEEFHKIAEEKTKQILEAYRYFEKKLQL